MRIQTFSFLVCLSFALHAWRIKVEANVAHLHLVSLMFSLNSGHQADEQACTPACSLDDSCLRGGKKAAGVKNEKKKNKTIQRARLKRASSACAWMTPMRPIAPVEAVIQRLTVNTDWKSEPRQKREGVALLRSLLSEMCYDSKQICIFLFAFQVFFCEM